MTIRKAKRLLEELEKTIHATEDEAMKEWDKPETLGSEVLNDILTRRYTCRRALRSWLNRRTR